MTWIVWPVMKPQSSVARKVTAAAMSSTCPSRPQRNLRCISHVLAGVPSQVAAGVDAPRRHYVDPDVVRRELRRQPPCQTHDAHLGRRHMGPLSRAVPRPVAGQEHDAAKPACLHRRDGVPGAVERPVQHHAGHPFPVVQRQVGERLVRPYRSVAHQHIDIARTARPPRRTWRPPARGRPRRLSLAAHPPPGPGPPRPRTPLPPGWSGR